jgi:hypothetical protein
MLGAQALAASHACEAGHPGPAGPGAVTAPHDHDHDHDHALDGGERAESPCGVCLLKASASEWGPPRATPSAARPLPPPALRAAADGAPHRASRREACVPARGPPGLQSLA